MTVLFHSTLPASTSQLRDRHRAHPHPGDTISNSEPSSAPRVLAARATWHTDSSYPSSSLSVPVGAVGTLVRTAYASIYTGTRAGSGLCAGSSCMRGLRVRGEGVGAREGDGRWWGVCWVVGPVGSLCLNLNVKGMGRVRGRGKGRTRMLRPRHRGMGMKMKRRGRRG